MALAIYLALASQDTTAVSLYPAAGKPTNFPVFLGHLEDEKHVANTFVFPLSYRTAEVLGLPGNPASLHQSVLDELHRAGIGEDWSPSNLTGMLMLHSCMPFHHSTSSVIGSWPRLKCEPIRGLAVVTSAPALEPHLWLDLPLCVLLKTWLVRMFISYLTYPIGLQAPLASGQV